jgi:hypothetical protein
MQALRGEEIWLLLIIDLGTGWSEWSSVTPLPRFTPGERNPGTHCTGGWVGLRAGLDTEAKRTILCLCREYNPVVQSAVRHYTDGPQQLRTARRSGVGYCKECVTQ